MAINRNAPHPGQPVLICTFCNDPTTVEYIEKRMLQSPELWLCRCGSDSWNRNTVAVYDGTNVPVVPPTRGTLNRYEINVTIEAIVSVEAESEAEALDMADDAVRNIDLSEGAEITAKEIADTIIDGPANYEKWLKAVGEYHDAVDRHGKNSVEAKALSAAVDKIGEW